MVAPLVLPVAAMGMSAAGAVMGGMAASREAKRRKKVLEEAARRRKGIQGNLIQAHGAAGKIQRGSLIDYLSQMPDAQAQGQQMATARRADIEATAGPREMPSESLTAALYQQLRNRQAVQTQAADATGAVGLGQRQVGDVGRSQGVVANSAAVPLADAKGVAQRDLIDLEGWLSRELGDTPNDVHNLNLMSNLLGAGGKTAWAFA